MDEVGTLRWLPDGQEQPAHAELTLLLHALMADREHDQACGGQAECGTCRVRVVSGAALSPPTPMEQELRREFPDALAADERLACMTRPLGDVTIAVPPAPLDDLRDR